MNGTFLARNVRKIPFIALRYLSSALVFPRILRATISCWICWVPSKMSRIFRPVLADLASQLGN
jgi:hypothetical protein